jgi:transposase
MPSNTTGHNEQVEVIIGTDRRKRYRTEDKLTMLEEAQQPGQTYSGVARKYGVSISLMFVWRKQYEMGAFTSVKAGEEVVPASEFRAAQQKIRDLERMLGKKTMENEILQEAVRIGREKKLVSRMPLFPRDEEQEDTQSQS